MHGRQHGCALVTQNGTAEACGVAKSMVLKAKKKKRTRNGEGRCVMGGSINREERVVVSSAAQAVLLRIKRAGTVIRRSRQAEARVRINASKVTQARSAQACRVWVQR